MTNYLAIVYGTYLVATIGLCTWLALTFFRNGAVFLKDVFPDRPEMADAVNRLLVTGFAMLNLGYGFFLLQGGHAIDGTEAFEVLARKLGILLVSLAVFHFANMLAFHKLASRRTQRDLAPPIAPQRWVDDFQPGGDIPKGGSWAPTPPPPPIGGTTPAPA